MRLDKFKKQVSDQGLARSNKWEVKVYPPRGLTAAGRALSNELTKNGTRLDINLPGFDTADSVIGTLNDAIVDLGPVNIGRNTSLPTLGYVLTNMGDKLDSISLFTEEATLPGRDLQNLEFKEYGEKRSLGVEHVHQGIVLTFYCSEDMRERLFFEQWQDLIFNPRTKSHAYYKDYIGDIEILKYNNSWSENTTTYKLKEAYPTNIAQQQLSMGEGEILKLEVTFNYRNYERIK